MNRSISRRELARIITAKLLLEPTKQRYWLEQLAAYIVEHKLSGDVDLLINDIAYELFVQAGYLTIEVTTAKRLSATVRSSLEKYLIRETAANSVIIHELINPKLIGGLIARTADAELDMSIKKSLQQITAAV